MDKMKDVDLREALGLIAENNTFFHLENDLGISIAQMERLAKLNDYRDKRLIWVSYPSGIDCYPELEVFQKDTRGYNGVLFHGKDTQRDRTLAYTVIVHEVKDGKLIGSLYETDIQKYAKSIQANAVQSDKIRIYEENGRQTTMPNDEFHRRYPKDLVNMAYWRHEPDNFASLKPVANAVIDNMHSEQLRSCDIWQHRSKLYIDRNKFYSNQILLDLDKLHEPNSEDKEFFTTPLNACAAAALAPDQLSFILDFLPFENAEFSIKRGQADMLVKVPRDEVLLDRSRQQDKPIVVNSSKQGSATEQLNKKQHSSEKPSILKALKQDAKKPSKKEKPKKSKKKSKETEI